MFVQAASETLTTDKSTDSQHIVGRGYAFERDRLEFRIVIGATEKPEFNLPVLGFNVQIAPLLRSPAGLKEKHLRLVQKLVQTEDVRCIGVDRDPPYDASLSLRDLGDTGGNSA